MERYGYADQVQLRLCDGLAAVQPGEVDTVTICGMGGKMMISILEAAPWTTDGVTLILQPMKVPGELRHGSSATATPSRRNGRCGRKGTGIP